MPKTAIQYVGSTIEDTEKDKVIRFEKGLAMLFNYKRVQFILTGFMTDIFNLKDSCRYKNHIK